MKRQPLVPDGAHAGWGLPDARARMTLHAFTLVELLVVVAIIGVLAGLLLSAVGKSKAKAQQMICLSNIRQLQLAWLLYTDEQNEVMPPHKPVQTNGRWGSVEPSWVLGNAIYDVAQTNLSRGLIWNYVKGTAGVYLCPSDRSVVRQAGGLARRIRSYSTQGQLHPLAGWSPSPPFLLYKKLSEIQAPDPGGLMVFIEASAASIDTADYGWTVGNWSPGSGGDWWTLPSDRHTMKCLIGYADGHVAASVKWRYRKENRQAVNRILPGGDTVDFLWMQAGRPRS